MSNTEGSIQVLQLGRAIAALAVVMHHAEQAANAFVAGDNMHLFGWGMYGVDFFFVLSGFIIYYVHGSDKSGILNARSYLLKRMIRIYVPYLPIGLGMVLIYTSLPSLSAADRSWGLWTSLTLFPSTEPPALSVAWTLVFEIIFYGVFAIKYFTGHFSKIIVAWILSICFLWFMNFEFSNPLFSRLFDPIVIEFIIGMIAAKVVKDFVLKIQWAKYALLFGLIGVSWFILALANDVFLHRAWLSPFLASLVMASVMMERGSAATLPRFPLMLGSASYAIYLVHNPIASVVARFTRQLDSLLATFTICVVFGVVAGLIYHVFYEKPALKYIRSRMNI